MPRVYMPQFGSDGGPSVTYMAPKMAAFKAQVHGATGLNLNVVPLQDKHLLACAVGLEGLGGILFVLDSDLGALMLLTFLVVVTPCVPVPEANRWLLRLTPPSLSELCTISGAFRTPAAMRT